MTEVTTARRSGDGLGSAPKLEAVRTAAERALDARASDGDTGQAQQELTDAAKAALDHGHALSVVAEAEAAGQAAARDRLRKDVLRRVERSARKLREATTEHENVVAQADALGLGAREIAERASIAHGTVAAIVRRHRQRTDLADDDVPSRDGDRSTPAVDVSEPGDNGGAPGEAEASAERSPVGS